jgi:hypothetical protein
VIGGPAPGSGSTVASPTPSVIPIEGGPMTGICE